MSSSLYPELSRFLSYFSETDSDKDSESTVFFAKSLSPEKLGAILAEAKVFIQAESLVEDLGMLANRWFGDLSEAREWLDQVLKLLQSAPSGDEVVVKDSNGAVLSEGDAVTVIKDLKVKGGSSDLKRGTLIKKVHLIGDPDNVECNVDGSTLVLKTCFLKKA